MFTRFRHCERIFLLVVVTFTFLLCTVPASAQVKRVVIIKCDGLPPAMVDRFVRDRDARTGKSQLPWIDHVFYQGGTRLANFYVRGMSLSAPSWSLLETGQHLQIKGNVEFDRYTLHTYDYLNFIPFYMARIGGVRVDMPAVEVLDAMGTPMLTDAFAHNERYVGMSLFQRGGRLITFQKSLENTFKRPPKELLDEWTMGLNLRDSVPEQLLRDVLLKLEDQQVRYVELVMQDFDHVGHHNNDRESHLAVLKQIDFTIGRIWTAIQKTPLADETALILISDHGFNTSEGVYSQGYNLVKLLGSQAGGGHHVVTKRRLLLDYSLKSIYPLVPLITSTTKESFYLKGQSTVYPTALLDFDGNERASIHLRDSDLNLLQILFQELQGKRLQPEFRRALTGAFFETINNRRREWQEKLDELNEELAVLRRRIEEQRKLWEAQPKKFSKEDQAAGRDDEARRIFSQLDRWMGQEKRYTEYAGTLANLLSLREESFAPGRLKIADLIGKNAMGERNSIYELQNYVAGVAPGGFVLQPNGSLDMEKSFTRVDYFRLLQGVTVRNNVQRAVSNQPIDMVATRISADLVLPLLPDRGINRDVVWVYGGPEKQALILSHEDEKGQMSFRYQPVKNLTQDAQGRVQFETIGWQPGLPLRIFEDKELAIPADQREAWLSQWHTELEWLHALHRTAYSNGLIGLHEELARHQPDHLYPDEAGISTDQRVARRFVTRQRDLIETDLLLVANNHWNFDVRGFNPGGNHGSFFRISTHSTFMIAGGEKTRLARAAVIEEPYDSLSFVPTVLALMGNLRDDSNPVPVLWDKGFRKFPGRVVTELIPAREKQRIALTGASASP
ncbi:MAG TPA: alkaline phosphatase family protein [Pyrinomonadaceae bacterium]|nr:alkaline phosphatase family protein [Pyrinomonadaceae bacterium]